MARGKYWTAKDLQTLSTHVMAGLSNPEIARLMLRSADSVKNKSSELRLRGGLPPGRVKVWTPAEIDELRTLAREGRSARYIARRLHRSRASISHKAQMLSVPVDTPNFRVWSPEKLALLEEYSAKGWTIARMSDALGISRHGIHAKRRMLGLCDKQEPREEELAVSQQKKATSKLIALLCEHHPEREVRI